MDAASGQDRKARPSKLPPWVILYGVTLLPLAFISGFSLWLLQQPLDEITRARLGSISEIAAATVKVKFDGLVDLGKSLATRHTFRQRVAEGRWREAADILADVPKAFPYIERIFLSDMAGTLRSDVPFVAEVQGRSFAYRDWYRGVSKEWKPYLSEVYVRAAAPQLRVFAVAVPIRPDGAEPLGVLVLQLRVETILNWTKELNASGPGFIYVVDQHGHAAAHPAIPVEGEPVDMSKIPHVNRALRGERGIANSFLPIDKEECLVAFQPVEDYGWIVVAEEPTRTAFGPRRRTLAMVAGVYAIAILVGGLLAARASSSLSRIALLNRELRALAEELQDANRDLESFAYSVSHDLRAPLRTVGGFSKILEDDHGEKLGEEGKRLIGIVRSGAVRMDLLITSLLAFSRVGRQGLAKRTVSTRELVEETIEELKPALEGRAYDLQAGELPDCKADPALLRQVFANLLSNAFKYTSKRELAKIDVGSFLGADGRRVWFVKDNGAGFPMKYAGKLFGVFQRLHRAEEFEGIGIGLALAERIIHRHGGRIWAEAEEDKGAAFYFTLGDEA